MAKNEKIHEETCQHSLCLEQHGGKRLTQNTMSGIFCMESTKCTWQGPVIGGCFSVTNSFLSRFKSPVICHIQSPPPPPPHTFIQSIFQAMKHIPSIQKCQKRQIVTQNIETQRISNGALLTILPTKGFMAFLGYFSKPQQGYFSKPVSFSCIIHFLNCKSYFVICI